MISLSVVSPFDRGWCLKIASTGEVMCFRTCGMAQRRGLALAAEATSLGSRAEIHVQDAGGRLIGRWVDNEFLVEPQTDEGLLAA